MTKLKSIISAGLAIPAIALMLIEPADLSLCWIPLLAGLVLLALACWNFGGEQETWQ